MVFCVQFYMKRTYISTVLKGADVISSHVDYMGLRLSWGCFT